MEFNFTLKYRLPDTGIEIGVLEQRLAEGGCDDALVGLGLPGRLALAFCREADSAGLPCVRRWTMCSGRARCRTG